MKSVYALVKDRRAQSDFSKTRRLSMSEQPGIGAQRGRLCGRVHSLNYISSLGLLAP